MTAEIGILPPPAEPPIDLKWVVAVKDKPAKQADWTEVANYDQSGPYSNSPYVFKSGFEIKSPVEQTSKDFDSIGGSKESFGHRAQQLAIELAAKLCNGNEAEWTRIWGPAGGRQFSVLRQLFHSTNGLTLKSISEVSQTVVETGNYLMAVHAKDNAFVRVFIDGKVREGGISGFLFARSRGKWLVRAPDGNWRKLPDDFQRF